MFTNSIIRDTIAIQDPMTTQLQDETKKFSIKESELSGYKYGCPSDLL